MTKTDGRLKSSLTKFRSTESESEKIRLKETLENSNNGKNYNQYNLMKTTAMEKINEPNLLYTWKVVNSGNSFGKIKMKVEKSEVAQSPCINTELNGFHGVRFFKRFS